MVIGVDEVGRGAWAGPLVMAAVAIDVPSRFGLQTIDRGGFFHWSKEDIRITDSKKLNCDQRVSASEWIKANSTVVEVVEISACDINERGIRSCWDAGLNVLLERVPPETDRRWVIDGNWLTEQACSKGAQALIKGDGKEFAIACASIVAKVYRDALMITFAEKYTVYDWESNKGYGTRRHREAIVTHGVCDQHRELWVRKLV